MSTAAPELRHRLTGILPPIAMPFDAEGRLIESALKAQVDMMIAAGVRGIVAGGSTGEGHTLSDEEFVRAMTAAHDAVAGRVTFVAGLIVNSTRQALERVSMLKGLAIDALQVTPVHYLFKPDADSTVKHFREIADTTRLPVLIYNVIPWNYLSDTVARTLVKNAKKYLGVNVNVVNRTGGTGAVGMQAAAQAKPDGYTLGLITFHLSSYRLMGVSQLSYRDFEPIMLINRSPAAFVVRSDSQFKEMKELVDYARQNPGVVTVANSGAGATPHLTTLQLAKQQGLKFTMVPFDGAAPARTAVLGGHVTLLATGADEVLQFYKTRQMRFLAVMNEQRHPAFPDAPTLAEAGFGLDQLILDWRGLGAPKGTPPEVTQALRAGFLKMAEDPDFIRLMDELALPRALLEGEKFGEFLAGMEKTMEPALKEANLLKKE